MTPLSTSMISRDTIAQTRRDVKNGARSGIFSFGKDTDRGIRGFYRSPTGGPVPVVASASFMRRTGTAVGNSLIVNIFGRLIPVRIMDSVDYFPTLDPAGNGFLVSDLDSLLRHLNILTPVGSIRPNELMLTQAAGSGEDAYQLALSPRALPAHGSRQDHAVGRVAPRPSDNRRLARHDAGSLRRYSIRRRARIYYVPNFVRWTEQGGDGLLASARTAAKPDDAADWR